jgi:hypothetical protein
MKVSRYLRSSALIGASLVAGALLAVPLCALQGAQGAQPGARGQGGGRGAAPAAITPQDPKTLKRDPLGHPDFTGMWDNQYTPDLTAAVPGGQLPFTAYGAERWKKVDLKNDPTGLCLPVGPSRAFTAPLPVYILQTPKVVGFLFEYQTIYRMAYIDGKHPEDLGDYGSEFMGHSIGRWEGDALVVDTIGINERSWLDTAGHEHSDKLHLTERFEKINDDNVKYTVTYDDPVFFTTPVTITRSFKRSAAKDRILPYSCEENNTDVNHLMPTVKP